MSLELEDGQRAFSTFRVLNGDANILERDQLFRNMAQLYSYVSDRCDDEQVAQYDEVLCQLAALVEVEARTHVAKLLAPLDRAPGNVVNKLANDTIEVAAPLLEFSNVLSDDDLIEIVTKQSEEHRVAIAGRTNVPERVGDAIVEPGFRLLEVPLNSPQPLESIALMRKRFPQALVGAGTVLAPQQVRDVHAAGGELIVSPNYNADVIAEAARLGMVCLPGVM
eukprot:gene3229-4399_t